MAQERLDKLLSSTGRWSRREVKELIRQGAGVGGRRPCPGGRRRSVSPERPASLWTESGWTAPLSSI